MSWTQRELALFSLGRAISMAADGGLKPSLERELLEEHARDTGRTFTPSRFTLPFALLARDLTTASAAPIVATDSAAARDVLRESSVVARLGAEVIPAGRGNLVVPVVSSGVQGGWLGDENAPMSAEQPAVGQVTLTPKHAAALVVFSHLIARQAPTTDAILARHIARAAGALLDAAVFSGSGSSGEPLGIANTTGVGSITGAAFDLGAALDAVEDIRDAATEPSAWVMPPAVATLLAQRDIGTDTGRMLLQDGRIAGIPAVAAKAAPASSLALADWSQLAVATWGDGIEIATDPYTGFTTGSVKMRVMLLCDVAIMHRAAVAYTGELS